MYGEHGVYNKFITFRASYWTSINNGMKRIKALGCIPGNKLNGSGENSLAGYHSGRERAVQLCNCILFYSLIQMPTVPIVQSYMDISQGKCWNDTFNFKHSTLMVQRWFSPSTNKLLKP